ncbi:MAG: hypothetical protein JWQ87_5426 [Candidatus Sulfotelmatobacter sp.]|nr:hypothetical protein [Candidatus Sulfotelmatobacter sp.]
MKLERVKPTEDAVLEMVRNHYSHRSNVAARPRTEKTSKTWWSNAKLLVFSDPGRTFVFAWQWPKVEFRADKQSGFNNTMFHRSDRCVERASDIILAAEQAVIAEWGPNRAYTYVDPEEVSANPGYCYKMAGWEFVKIAGSGKHLLQKELCDDR